MKKIINRYTIASLAILLLLGACSKNFITKAPNDSILSDAALASVSDLQTALTGAYAELRITQYYGRDFPVIGDLMADNTYVEIKNSNRYIPQYKYTVLTTDAVPGDIWPSCYTTILRVNNILDSKVTGAGIDGIRAQALALRALSYFKMVTYFAAPYTTDTSAAGVPLILHYEPFDLPARSSVGTVYAQIVSDLTTAIPLAPDFSSSVFLSKYAIEGLLAKVYLYMGNYALAQTTAADVINNSGFTLVTPANYAAFWADPGIKTTPVEVMFEVNEDVLTNNGFDDLGGIYVNGYSDIYCSDQLYNLYSATDVRTQVLIPNSTTKSGAAAVVVNKYPNAGNADRDNPKVLRLAEVYLAGAEAAARNSDNTSALNWLNTLMANRDPAFAGYTATGSALIDSIVNERRKELAFEGDRFFDMNRLGLPINRGSNPGAIPSAPLSIAYPDYRRLAPIPNSEIQANPNIATEQNPGY
jgi:starch-binding outer membrane protein, SusD/RagB family